MNEDQKRKLQKKIETFSIFLLFGSIIIDLLVQVMASNKVNINIAVILLICLINYCQLKRLTDHQ